MKSGRWLQATHRQLQSIKDSSVIPEMIESISVEIDDGGTQYGLQFGIVRTYHERVDCYQHIGSGYLDIGSKTIGQRVDFGISMCTAASDVLAAGNLVTCALTVWLYNSHSMYKVARCVSK